MVINSSIFFRTGLFVWLILSTQSLCSQNNHAEIITNYSVISDDLISIVVRVKNGDQSINTSVNGSFQIITSPAILENNIIRIYKGIGSVTTKVFTSEEFEISIENFSGHKTVLVNNNASFGQISGVINTNTSWLSDSLIYINNDLTISQGATLMIGPGVRVFLGEKVNIFVEGKIEITGIPEKPVFFQPFNPDTPWGGIFFFNPIDTSSICYSFFIYGGNNQEFIFGHSESQPVFLVDHSYLNLNNTFILDNPGKAIGGNFSKVNVEDCVISRCDTGGEYKFCLINFSNSYFVEIPNNDGVPDDDDNDASYFYATYPNCNEPSMIDNCVFITGKDDGIDHNSANLNILNCWIEGFDNEGIAASNSNNIYIYNTLIQNCEQGIEAGYGEPIVSIDHCVLIDNEVGLRFGDSYNWGCEGHINTTNSILHNNVDNILNFDLLNQGSVEGAIDISYSLTNDTDYDNYPNCITGVPLFDENYFLLPGSPGIGIAADGSDLGLINPDLSVYDNLVDNVGNFKVSPNPFEFENKISFQLNKNADVLLKVFNNSGNLIFRQNFQNLQAGQHIIPFNNKSKYQGLFFFTLLINNKKYITKKVIAL